MTPWRLARPWRRRHQARVAVIRRAANAEGWQWEAPRPWWRPSPGSAPTLQDALAASLQALDRSTSRERGSQ
jgi:hypothetical protein